MNKVDELAKILWDYHHVNHVLKPAEFLFCFTSLDLTVPVHCAELFKKGFAPMVLISGGNAHNDNIPDENNIQKTNWGKDSEAEVYYEIITKEGVPPEKIILETKSSNSGENVLFTYEILKKLTLLPKQIILLHKPTMERRAFASFMNYWSDKTVDLIVTSKPYKYEDYIGRIIDRDVIINIMVGDLQRIQIYPEMGYQIYQEIPNEVWTAYEILVELGYNKHLTKR